MHPSGFVWILEHITIVENQLAFIDEFGNNGLDFAKSGTSTHFIVTSVIIDKDYLNAAEEILEKVRSKHFQKSEMKSSKLKDNDTRRINVLEDLNEIDYHIFTVVVDKRELTSEGFKYKGSFYKFLHSLVDRDLFRTFPNLLIVADEHGSDKFKEGFIEYMHRRHVPDLFDQSEFKLSNSKSQLMVQLADIISGTLARCYDERKLSDRRQDLLETIKSKIILIKEWPVNYRPTAYVPKEDFKNYDPQISELGMNIARQFLKSTEKTDVPYEIDQRSCLQYLLFHFTNINPETYVSTHELIEHIVAVRESNISMHYFRSRIVAKLRDDGVIIASSNKGYKLPSSTSDLYEFINHSNSYIQPMIDRVIKCRNQIYLATKKKIDIMDQDEFKYLKIIKENMP